MHEHNPHLSRAIRESLYGDNPIHEQLRREAIKAELDRAKQLVDAGRLACIIVTEKADAAGSQLKLQVHGEGRYLHSTAQQLSRRFHQISEANPT